MQACIIEAIELLNLFDVTNGTKQGCLLASFLFAIFFAMMLLVAFKDCDLGVSITVPDRRQCI